MSLFNQFVSSITMCHCSICSKAPGSAFNGNASVEGFRITAGKDAIKEYRSAPGKWRAFCSFFAVRHYT